VRKVVILYQKANSCILITTNCFQTALMNISLQSAQLILTPQD